MHLQVSQPGTFIYLLDIDFVPSLKAYNLLTIKNRVVLGKLQALWMQKQVNTVLITPAFSPTKRSIGRRGRLCQESSDCDVFSGFAAPLGTDSLAQAIAEDAVEVFEFREVRLDDSSSTPDICTKAHWPRCSHGMNTQNLASQKIRQADTHQTTYRMPVLHSRSYRIRD